VDTYVVEEVVGTRQLLQGLQAHAKKSAVQSLALRAEAVKPTSFAHALFVLDAVLHLMKVTNLERN
jgi:hypothetical protein